MVGRTEGMLTRGECGSRVGPLSLPAVSKAIVTLKALTSNSVFFLPFPFLKDCGGGVVVVVRVVVVGNVVVVDVVLCGDDGFL